MQIGIPAGADILNSLAAVLVTLPAMLMLLENVGA
jgi:predicted RND superfamily exporter protein